MYKKIDISISMVKANLISIGLLVPSLVIPVGLFILLWDIDRLFTGLANIFEHPLYLIGGFILLVILHELIHGLTWQFLTGADNRLIQYGFQWKTITPYAHIKKPIGIQPYRWGAAMPGIILGIIPLIIGLLIGKGEFYIIGVFMTYAASGDMIVLFLLRDVKKPALVEDHPTNAGCYILVEGD